MSIDEIRMYEPRFDQGRHPRAKLGFVLLATEQTIEDDMMLLRPAGVGVHFTRAPIPDSITVETLSVQIGGLAQAASLILPDGSLDVCCYACTSGSAVMGDEEICKALHAGAPNSRSTTLLSGVVDGLLALGVKRIALVTPYVPEINEIEARYLQGHGFDVTSITGLGLEKDSDMVRVDPDLILELGRAADRDDPEAVFISCGALRSIDIVEQLEKELGKPVVVSNQAMMWQCLRLAGIEDAIEGYGTLLKLPGVPRHREAARETP